MRAAVPPGWSAAVAVPREPVRAASVRDHVEHLPDRPHVVDMARMLARLRLRSEELAAPAMVDRAAALREDMSDRKLPRLVGFGVVVAVERRARRRVQRCEAPAALVAPRRELLD